MIKADKVLYEIAIAKHALWLLMDEDEARSEDYGDMFNALDRREDHWNRILREEIRKGIK